MKFYKAQAKGSEYYPALSFDPWQVVARTDDNGFDWVANEDFKTEEEADAFIASPFNEAAYTFQGASYSLGQVDEHSLMDDEELANR
jgi:hypothetical protein